MEKKLTVTGILTEGVVLGLKNIASLLGAVVLWVLTIWIPYVNVGTTIAIASLPLSMSRGKVISPLEIFDKKYFTIMGEYFLLIGLMYAGILAGMMFFIIPGYVIMIAWSLAILLLIDKGLNPVEALTKSNKLTQGKKWTIFGAYIVLSIALVICFGIFSLLPDVLARILMVVAFICVYPMILGCQAVIYKTLTEEPKEEIVQ